MSHRAIKDQKNEMISRNSTLQEPSANNTGAEIWSALITSSQQISFIFGSRSQLENLNISGGANHELYEITWCSPK